MKRTKQLIIECIASRSEESWKFFEELEKKSSHLKHATNSIPPRNTITKKEDTYQVLSWETDTFMNKQARSISNSIKRIKCSLCECARISWCMHEIYGREKEEEHGHVRRSLFESSPDTDKSMPSEILPRKQEKLIDETWTACTRKRPMLMRLWRQ